MTSSAESAFAELLAAVESALPELYETARNVAEVIEAIASESVTAAAQIASSDASLGGRAGRLLVATQLAERLQGPADRLEGLASAYEDQLHRLDHGMTRLIAEVENDPGQLTDIDDLAHAIHGMAMGVEHGLGQGEPLADSLETVLSVNRALRTRTARLRDALVRMASTWHVIRDWSDRLRAVEASSRADANGLDEPKPPPRSP